jgi:hypothetical protein
MYIYTYIVVFLTLRSGFEFISIVFDGPNVIS